MKHEHNDSHKTSSYTFGPTHGESIKSKALEWKLLLSSLFLFSFMLIEIIGGLISGSLALIADGTHLVTDVLALVLTFIAIRIARRKNNKKLTYGFTRIEVLVTFLNALTLLATIAYIFYEAILRFFKPIEVLSIPMFFIAIAGLIANLIVMKTLHTERKKEQNNLLALEGAFLHVISDTLGSILVIVSSIIIYFTGIYVVDPILSLAIVFLVGKTGYRMLKETSHILLEGTPRKIDIDEIQKTLVKSHEGIVTVHHIHAWSLSSAENIITMHVGVKNIEYAPSILIKLKRTLAEKFNIKHSTIQIEPEDFVCPDDENS